MSDASSAIIRVEHLVKCFGEFAAVNDISFSVEKGVIFAFLGPNGAGKTTTIKMLTTLLHPTSGSIMVNGHDPVSEQDAVRRSFGIVFQDQSLDDELTALENMELHGVLYGVEQKKRRQRIEELLQLIELWDRRNDIVKTFSGGMKRRLEIARSLIHHPAIIFLDEPTLGLDPQTRNHLWKYLVDLNQKEFITIFFTTHYMEEAARLAQRVAIIDRGTILIQGSPEELKAATKTATLEDAFLSLTGRGIREEEASGIDQLQQHRKIWGR